MLSPALKLSYFQNHSLFSRWKILITPPHSIQIQIQIQSPSLSFSSSLLFSFIVSKFANQKSISIVTVMKKSMTAAI
ncbi:hypothetical protein MtrunA17_Chr7g0270291 [Medicago truncatula]|uniref:Uncharacterized protein n=1 Tax=Medicago truncatula TaxID=3880 RepID=A0A396H720_MEDTR|nr:hypothetical protein MtrunA17_Chr7g0270291 [Medicago truncatula]